MLFRTIATCMLAALSCIGCAQTGSVGIAPNGRGFGEIRFNFDGGGGMRQAHPLPTQGCGIVRVSREFPRPGRYSRVVGSRYECVVAY